MTTYLTTLSPEDCYRLREADARRLVAESGTPVLTPEEAARQIVEYYELVDELYGKYDLDEEETYTFDLARGAIFQEYE